jgi:hypothetical protein
MLFGGLVADTQKPAGKAFKFSEENKSYLFLDLDLPAGADKSITEFYNYFQHLFTALVNTKDVWMD